MFSDSLFSKVDKSSHSKTDSKLTKKRKYGEINKTLTNNQVNNRVKNNLQGSKFRLLNEYLYTNDSKESYNYFQKNKVLFDEYHNGFKDQIQKWPAKPIELVIKELETNPVFNDSVVCDLGCGEGFIYEYFSQRNKIKEDDYKKIQQKENNNQKGKVISNNDSSSNGNIFKKIYSFDLVSKKPFITECDIKSLPLGNKSVDVAIFCLALMGLNYLEFILEAKRCLSKGGYLIIAEVLSRINDTKEFIRLIKNLGFNFKKYIKENTYFIILIFQKLNMNEISDNNELKKKYSEESKKILSPCIYKRRQSMMYIF